jgi:hypothetical protein
MDKLRIDSIILRETIAEFAGTFVFMASQYHFPFLLAITQIVKFKCVFQSMKRGHGKIECS